MRRVRYIAGLIALLILVFASCSSPAGPLDPPPVADGPAISVPGVGETELKVAAESDPSAADADVEPPPDEDDLLGLHESEAGDQEELEPLVVRFLDVGQGDSTLLQGPGFTILIDAGRHDRDDVVPHLKAVGVEIDLLIGTHGHADHIGQMDQVLATFPVRAVWLNGAVHTTKVFERVIDAILATDADYHEPRAGEKFSIGPMHMQVLNPRWLSGYANDDSIVIRLQYGDVTFLFAGDAESEAERGMLASGLDVQADILRVGHHGSRTSTTEPFLKAVAPRIAVYSAGADNTYGHPHREVVSRILATGAELYGTDTHGTITVVTDGQTYTVRTEKDPG